MCDRYILITFQSQHAKVHNYFIPHADYSTNTGGRYCFAPTPFRILAVSKNDSNEVDLSWNLDIAPPGTITCGELTFSVQIRTFATYEDYKVRAARNITGDIPVERGVNHFTATVEENMYYLFDISVEFYDTFDMRNKQRVTTSPVFYFGVQGEHVCAARLYQL